MISQRVPLLERLQLRRSTLVTAAAGFTVTIAASAWLHQEEETHQEMAFLQEAHERLDAVEWAISDMSGTLILLARMFSDLNKVSEEQFRFSTQLFLAKRPHVFALTYHEAGQHRAQAVPTADIRRTAPDKSIGMPISAFAIPAARPQPVHYMEIRKTDGSSPDALPERLSEALEEIIRNTVIPLTPNVVRLPSDIAGSESFVLIAPVHANPILPREQTGYVNVVFRFPNLVTDALQRSGFLSDRRFNMALYDVAPTPGAVPLAMQGIVPGENAMRDANWHYTSRSVDLMGQALHMVVAAPNSSSGMEHIGSWLMLVGGFLVTATAAAWVQSHVSHAGILRKSNAALAANVAERQLVEEELRKSQDELRQLTAHQHQVREDERKRIAREVHDDLGQNLLALRIGLSLLGNDVGQRSSAAEHIKELQAQIDTTIRSMRRIINNLRPTVLDLGLRDAIEWQVEQMNRQHQVFFSLVDLGENVGEGLDDERSTSVFRLVQESMSNVIRHANARTAQICISQKDGQLSIDILDDGIGLGDRRHKPGSFGLIGMKERIAAMGGHFAITGLRGKGTLVSLTIPVDPEQPQTASGPPKSLPPEAQSAPRITGSLNT